MLRRIWQGLSSIERTLPTVNASKARMTARMIRDTRERLVDGGVLTPLADARKGVATRRRLNTSAFLYGNV